MHTLTLLLLLAIGLHTIHPFTVRAEEGVDTGTGITMPVSATSSGSAIDGIDTNTGSVLIDEEVSDHQNDSISGSTIMDVPPVVIHSPLLVRISEIAWAGSDLSTADEWFELSAVPLLSGAVITKSVNLRGWSVTIRKDAGEAIIATVSQDLFLGSGGYLVIANSVAASSRLLFEPAIVSSSISLPNTKLQIRLYDDSGVLQDEVDDFVGAPFAGANPSAASGLPKASMERIDLRAPGIDKANWRTATTARGFDHGAAVLGTPGFENGSVEPPDTDPPPDVEHLQAYAFSGSLIVGWVNPAASDAADIQLTIGDAVYDLPPTATGAILPYQTDQIVSVQTIDHEGNISTGVSLTIISLNQPILSELLPDPPGSTEEWIELHNPSDQPLDLSGWMLQSGSRTFPLPDTSLDAGAHLLLFSGQTGLSLPNASGDVRLSYRGLFIDHILYTEMPDGISIGRGSDGTLRPFCVPTPGMINMFTSPTITLGGFLRNEPNPTSINVEVRALSGSIVGASCTVDFGDGFVSKSCNPPSHSMQKNGHMTVKTEVKDFCGNTITQFDAIQILPGSKSRTVSPAPMQAACIPTSTGGVVISEFLAAPSAGLEEWVELRNTSDDQIMLCGWSVDDAVGGSAPYRLDHLAIDAGQYLLLPSSESRVALNNDADTVRLIAPDGKGGTGVVLFVPYQDAETDQSIALRDDGVYLATQFPTPASDNRFMPVDPTPGMSPVILSAAMPNPAGVDTWDEWIELTNLTGRPQWLNGWRIEDDTGRRLPLDGHVLAKREVRRIPLYKTGFTLGNTDHDLRLIDQQGIVRSVIAWHKTKDGRMVRRAIDCTDETFSNPTVTKGTLLSARTASGETVMLTMSGILQTGVLSDLHSSYKNEYVNYLSGLIKNKNIELKNCSSGSSTSLTVDGADLALLLLQSGLAIADPADTSARREEFNVYEREARNQRRGIWNNLDNGLIVDAWKADRMLDHVVTRDGLQVKVSHASGLLMTGSVISVETNVPADLWVRYGTGAYRPFDGGVFLHDDSVVSFLAAYAFKTTSGLEMETSVLTQSYSVRKPFYASCIRISEVYPSPKKGENEWVELENVCDEDVSLLGWIIDDEPGTGSKPFMVNTSFIVPAGGLGILSGALLPVALNNGGDSIVLLDPNASIQSVLSYGKTTAGRGWALMGDAPCPTFRLTPLSANMCELPLPKTKKAVAAKAAKSVIGLSTKYVGGLLSLENMNTKDDQYKGLLEGLNRNMNLYNKRGGLAGFIAAFLFLTGLSAVGTGVVLYGRKWRLWQ